MIKKETFLKIIEEHPTPLFVFDVDELRERTGNIRDILNSGEKEIGLCYSIKANPFLIPYISDLVDKFEVCSPGELAICEAYKVDPDKIIYSGVHKEAEDIEEAIRYGSAILTAESVRHYEMIRDVAQGLGKKISLILRITSKNQFGMSLEDAKKILDMSRDNGFISVDGIHYFAGTQRVKLKHQIQELSMLKDIINDLRTGYGLGLEIFEYGPGLAFPYFEGDDFSDTLRPLRELSGELAEMAKETDMTVEMGRFLASSCGYYLTEVRDVKVSYDNTWCILDGGINHVNYLGQMMGMKTPVIITLLNEDERQLNNTSAQTESQVLCGSLCTTNDVLVRNYKGERLTIGDVLVFCNTGAYSVTEGLNLFLSRDMPVVLIHKDGIILKVRDVHNTWKLNS